MNDVIAAALIAGGFTAVGALGTGWLTFKVTKRSITTQESEGDENRKNDRIIHAHDRAFDRHAEACIGVAQSVSWTQDYVIYWNAKAMVSDPKNVDRLIQLPIPGVNEADLDASPQPPESWSGVMRGQARLYLDGPTRLKLNELLVSFTQYQSVNATLHYSETTALPIARTNLLQQLESLGDEVHQYASQLIDLLRGDLDSHSKV